MDAWSLMRGNVFIHFVCGSRRVNIRLGVLLLIPKSPQYIATRNSGAIARISVECVDNSWSVFRFLTIVMTYVGRWVIWLLPLLCVVNMVIVLRKANTSVWACDSRFFGCVLCLRCRVSWCIVVCCPPFRVFAASVTIVVFFFFKFFVGMSSLFWVFIIHVFGVHQWGFWRLFASRSPMWGLKAFRRSGAKGKTVLP